MSNSVERKLIPLPQKKRKYYQLRFLKQSLKIYFRTNKQTKPKKNHRTFDNSFS